MVILLNKPFKSLITAVEDKFKRIDSENFEMDTHAQKLALVVFLAWQLFQLGLVAILIENMLRATIFSASISSAVIQD